MEWFLTRIQPIPSADSLMTQAANAMKRNYDSDLKLHSIAEELGVTPVQLTRRFRAEYGVTPTDTTDGSM